MPRCKPYDYNQLMMIPVSLEEQLVPGTLEYAIHHLIEERIDTSLFNERFCNDEEGRRAYDPKVLLKIVLFGYSRGIISSRPLERACVENVTFMALACGQKPDHSTIAAFITSMGEEISGLFAQVLLVCDEEGLLGGTHFSLDGLKLSSNASKEWMGENEDKPGKAGQPIKSNITDNESAKMKSSHGVVQGYDGVAVVDSKHQVVVHAEAYGEAQEHGLLEPRVSGTRRNFQEIGSEKDVFEETKLTADAGFHTEANMKMLAEENIDEYVADILFRKRDPRFSERDRSKERHRQEQRKIRGTSERFTVKEFTFDEKMRFCLCPAGKRMYRNGGNVYVKGHQAVKFHGRKTDCGVCALRARCLRHPERSEARQVYFFTGRLKKGQGSYTRKMKYKIDSVLGRFIYSKRIGTAEPVFANIRHALGLNRFTLRGKVKVDIQWKLYCIVHKLLKVHRYGFQFG